MRQLRQTTKGLFLGVLLATACGAVYAAGISGISSPSTALAPRQVREVCKPDTAPATSLSHVQVRSVAAKANELPYYEARSNATGGSVRIYYEPDLADAAASKAACLMGMLDLMSTALPHMRGNVIWWPMVLTHNANYIPPQRDGETRWPNVFTSDTWDPATIRFLIYVLPHEEAHLSQSMSGAHLPRWFEEGHAEWAGLQVTEQIRPDLAQKERMRRAEAFRKLGVARLGSWGGIRVKPEAIERQLSAEDRARRAKDPSYNPPGPFNFKSGDFEEDNGEEEGRYGAALALFAGLEQRHGRTAVHDWVRAVLAQKDSGQIAPLARQVLGEDITPLLQ
jgi:hypothetical protein